MASLEYGKFLTPELKAELEQLGLKHGYAPGYFHVAYYLAQGYASKARKKDLREQLRFLILNPGLDQTRLDDWLAQQLQAGENPKRYHSFRLRQLRVRNFGPFPELQVQFAEGGNERPMTLIGAPNGSGKTTVFRALRAALYGLDKETGEERSPLYLDGANGSSIHLTLDLEDGEGTLFQIQREYSYQTGRGRPVLASQSAVLQRGIAYFRDHDLEDEVEQFLPSALHGYFFFDADKQIEQFLQNQQGALRVGIERILGIEMLNDLERQVEQLKAELSKNRKKINESNAGTTQKQIQEKLGQLDESEQQMRANREATHSRLRQTEADLAAAQADLEQLLTEFDPRKHEEYERVTRELGAAQEELKQTLDELERLARESLPLLLLTPELEDLLEQVQATQRSGQDSGLPSVLLDIYERGRQLFLRREYDMRDLDLIFGQYREQIQDGSATGQPIELTQPKLRGLEQLVQRQGEARRFGELLSRRETLSETLENCARKQSRLIPPKNDLAVRHGQRLNEKERLVREQLEIRRDISMLEEKLGTITREQAALRAQSEKADDYTIELQKVDSEIAQVEQFLKFLRASGKAFRSSRVHVLEEQASRAYRQLTNKPDLARHIAIDSETFAATLKEGSESKYISELSAGEQQIFAMALIAGLAGTSERRVPMIIDTPFGRLSRDHRHNICRNFLPYVAPQVIVLSTDEEIEGEAYELVKPHVGKAYLIERTAEGKEFSSLREGYFH